MIGRTCPRTSNKCTLGLGATGRSAKIRENWFVGLNFTLLSRSGGQSFLSNVKEKLESDRNVSLLHIPD